MSPSVGRLFV